MRLPFAVEHSRNHLHLETGPTGSNKPQPQ